MTTEDLKWALFSRQFQLKSAINADDRLLLKTEIAKLEIEIAKREGTYRACDECHEERIIVVVCMIGAHLCADCQREQNRISHDDFIDQVLREFAEAGY